MPKFKDDLVHNIRKGCIIGGVSGAAVDLFATNFMVPYLPSENTVAEILFCMLLATAVGAAVGATIGTTKTVVQHGVRTTANGFKALLNSLPHSNPTSDKKEAMRV